MATETIEDAAEERQSQCQEIVDRDDRFSIKQANYVLELEEDNNKTQAAIRAGYSEKTAKEQGYRLFTKVHIREEYFKRRLEEEPDRLIRRMRNITVLEDIRDTPDDKMLLDEIKVNGGEAQESKNSFHTFRAMNASNRIKAVSELAKINGDHPNTKVELSGANGDAIQHRHSTYEIVDAPDRDPIKEPEKKENNDS